MKVNKLLAVALALLVTVGVNAKVVDSPVATVNGKAIMSSDYDKLKTEVTDRSKQAQLAAMQNPDNITAIEEEVLNQMISNELLLQAAKAEGVKVKDSELAQGINEVKARFTIGDDGKPTEDKKQIEKNFNAELKKQGLTYKQFENKIRDEIAAEASVVMRLACPVVVQIP